jgi:hypothetical protein
MTSFLKTSLAISIAVNCALVTAVGARLNEGALKKGAVVLKPHPSRLVEIRMLKRQAYASARAVKAQRSSGTGEKNIPGKGEPGKGAMPSATVQPDELHELSLARQATGFRTAANVKRAIKVDVKSKLSGSLKVELAVPRPGVVPAYNGVLDLRNSKIKIHMHADRNKIPKNLLGKPNKFIGLSKVEYVGGRPKSTAVCVGSIGGRTVYASHLKIIGAQNIEISGTKFCAPGGLPIPVNGGSVDGSGQNHGLKPGNANTGQAFVFDPHQGDLNRKYGELSSGPANYVAEGAPPFQDGPVPGIAGEIRPPHLPDQDEDLNAPMSQEKPQTEPEAKKADKGPFPNLGSLSEEGGIPWGPMKAAPKYGLLADFYEGRNFEKYLFTRRTPHVNYRWTGMKVDPQLPLAVPYSVRWSGFIRPRYSETYKLYTCSDDGVRLYVNGKLVIDNWTNHADSEDVCEVPMLAGHDYAVRLEYYEVNGLTGQVIRLYWESPSQVKEYVPEHCLLYAK